MNHVQIGAGGGQATLVGGKIELVLVTQHLTIDIKQIGPVLDRPSLFIIQVQAPAHDSRTILSGQTAKGLKVGFSEQITFLAQQAF